jgi:hypothetical protein
VLELPQIVKQPPHFWDGMGGDVLGVVGSVLVALVVVWLTRRGDRIRMRAEAEMRAAEELMDAHFQLIHELDQQSRRSADVSQMREIQFAWIRATQRNVGSLQHEDHLQQLQGLYVLTERLFQIIERLKAEPGLFDGDPTGDQGQYGKAGACGPYVVSDIITRQFPLVTASVGADMVRLRTKGSKPSYRVPDDFNLAEAWKRGIAAHRRSL